MKQLVADYVASFLASKGIRDVFFIDGSAIASLLVGVAENPHLRYVCPWHEQAGAFAVDGYAKASGRMSVMMATSGPAGQNLINGIAASYYDSMPAMYFTGQINSRFIKPSPAVRQHGFQENDIVSMVKPVTKYAVLVRKVEDIRYELEKAYHLAFAGRPGPVLLDIPMDIQKATINPETLPGFVPEPVEPNMPALQTQIHEIVSLLKNAERPVILVGGGVWLAHAEDAVRKLVSTLGIPYYVTWNMIDFGIEQDPFYAGRVGTFGGDGRNFGIQNSDLLLALGSRISGRITGGMMDSFARAAKIIIVDIDPDELKYQQVKGDLNVCCDVKLFAELLQAETAGSAWNFGAWLARTKDWKRRYPVFQEKYWEQKDSVNPYVFVHYLSELMKEGDQLVVEAGGNCVVTSQAFQAKPNQRFFTNNGNSSLGYALPAAVGACVATGKPVICCVGDGGFNYNIQELQTVKHYNLPVKIMVYNNYAYGITKAYRDTHLHSNYAGVDKAHGVESPDFVKVAQAYGIKAVSIRDHAEMKEKLQAVLDHDGPVLCDINMIGFYNYNPKLGWGVPIEEQYPFLPPEEFRANMIIEPLPGWEDPVYPGKVR